MRGARCGKGEPRRHLSPEHLNLESEKTHEDEGFFTRNSMDGVDNGGRERGEVCG